MCVIANVLYKTAFLKYVLESLIYCLSNVLLDRYVSVEGVKYNQRFYIVA